MNAHGHHQADEEALRWEKCANVLQTKTAQACKRRYEFLKDEIAKIEAGKVCPFDRTYSPFLFPRGSPTALGLTFSLYRQWKLVLLLEFPIPVELYGHGKINQLP